MKTSISLPDEVAERAMARARALGVPFSRYVAEALREAEQAAEQEEATDQIRAFLAKHGTPDSSRAAAQRPRDVVAAATEW